MHSVYQNQGLNAGTPVLVDTHPPNVFGNDSGVMGSRSTHVADWARLSTSYRRNFEGEEKTHRPLRTHVAS
jgi:hypothetical protein